MEAVRMAEVATMSEAEFQSLAAAAAGREEQMMQAAVGLEKTPRRQLLGLLGLLQAALRDAPAGTADSGSPACLTGAYDSPERLSRVKSSGFAALDTRPCLP